MIDCSIKAPRFFLVKSINEDMYMNKLPHPLHVAIDGKRCKSYEGMMREF